jgi:uncharacterized membrane protein YidH (DUF202 family)
MTFDQLLENVVQEIINPFLALLFGAALLVFLWGLFEFIRDAESEDKRNEGKRLMLWGIIGLVIMLSAYGIINLVLGWFNLSLPN